MYNPVYDNLKINIIIPGEAAEGANAVRDLAKRLNVSILHEIPADSAVPLLCLTDKGLSLMCNGMEMRGDFTKMLPRLKSERLNGELLIKAAKIKDKRDGLTAIDATAGMGEDSLLLAAYGFNVSLYEYNPIIAALLEDTMRRAESFDELSSAVKRMTLFKQDSLAAMKRITVSPDVILLDPMFPERQKSALVKKKFQLLHGLEQPCLNERELLDAAMSARPYKIIVKRPPKGRYLAETKPDYSLNGKNVRYDCFVFSKNRR